MSSSNIKLDNLFDSTIFRSNSIVPLNSFCFNVIFFGFFSIIISALLIIYAFYLKFNGLAMPGSTSIIIAISFFSGILLFTLGIIGIYLARIFEQTKGRDQYVIKEIKDYK